MSRLLQGGYGRVVTAVRRWQAEGGTIPNRSAFVPLRFEPGDAFQFDWSETLVLVRDTHT